MKSDALTAAAVVFLIGLVASGLGITDLFGSHASSKTPTELHRGIAVTHKG